jgi:predicted phosphodiesterase
VTRPNFRGRLAVMADIHGNIWALDAVLVDIAQRGITQVVDLGDTVYGPFAPHATTQRLQQQQVLSVRGNCDRLVYEADAETSASLTHTRTELTADDVAWLRTFLPTRLLAGCFTLAAAATWDCRDW